MQFGYLLHQSLPSSDEVTSHSYICTANGTFPFKGLCCYYARGFVPISFKIEGQK